MKFSVIIPLFNKAQYVRAAVQSALGQTLPVHEVIVVDDGSSDAGLDTLRDIRDPRLILVRQDNAGVSAARNHGIRIATGSWIAFLDADDWYHPQLLSGLAHAHRSCPGADMLGAAYREVEAGWDGDRQGWRVPAEPYPCENIECLRTRWMEGSPFCTSSVAIRASRLKAMQPCFVEGEACGEDLDLWFRVSDSSPVARVKVPLAAYRQLPGGLSVTQQMKTLPPFLLRMQERAAGGELPAQRRAVALWFVAQQSVSHARMLATQGERRAALHSLWHARRLCLTRRWQITALMIVLLPARVTDRFLRWRLSRSTAATGGP